MKTKDRWGRRLVPKRSADLQVSTQGRHGRSADLKVSTTKLNERSGNVYENKG
ncbi:MAG: hypothetical protein ABSE79_14350 [Terriglobia bacterium]